MLSRSKMPNHNLVLCSTGAQLPFQVKDVEEICYGKMTFFFYRSNPLEVSSLLSASFLHRLNLYLNKDLSFSVGVYNLIQKAYKPYPVKLYRETNEPVKTKTRVFNGKTGSLLLPSDTKRAQVMYCLCAFSRCDFGVVAVGRCSAFYCFCWYFTFRMR